MKLTIWNLGMELMKEQGVPEQSARGLIGKMIKECQARDGKYEGERKVMHAIARMSIKDVADCKSYLIACCKPEQISISKEKKEIEPEVINWDEVGKDLGLKWMPDNEMYQDYVMRVKEARRNAKT